MRMEFSEVMKSKYRMQKENIIAAVYLLFYFIVNIFFLSRFPAMHSDESWLSGLSRTMVNEGFGATEYFFDLLPRYPHAIKIIFHMMQMPFICIFGYNLFAVRLLSLIFGMLCLLLFYKILIKLTKSFAVSFLAMAIISLDIQFIYASHFARQEIVMTAVVLAAILYIVSNAENWSLKNDIVTGLIIGMSIGIHPNSFLAALIAGSVYIYYILVEKKIKLRNLLFLIGTVSAFAAVFVGFSFLFDSNFINDYLKYGDDLGASKGMLIKILSFPAYYRKLYNAFSVTYYVPDIKAQFIFFAAGIAGGLVSLLSGRDKSKALLFLLPIAALNAGYIIIGRYSQPGIILLFPLCYLLIAILAAKMKKAGVVVLAVIGMFIIISTGIQIYNNASDDYNEYIAEIERNVPKDAEVLANLNSEYAFNYGALHDYRNLDALGDMSFSEYIYQNKIEYIIYPEEMDFIYENRPVWNVMYGNVYPYYEDMIDFLNEGCNLVHEFSSPYAMRIMMYSDDKAWKIKIYKVLESNSDAD